MESEHQIKELFRIGRFNCAILSLLFMSSALSCASEKHYILSVIVLFASFYAIYEITLFHRAIKGLNNE